MFWKTGETKTIKVYKNSVHIFKPIHVYGYWGIGGGGGQEWTGQKEKARIQRRREVTRVLELKFGVYRGL
jgi:hypothetical protein